MISKDEILRIIWDTLAMERNNFVPELNQRIEAAKANRYNLEERNGYNNIN